MEYEAQKQMNTHGSLSAQPIRESIPPEMLYEATQELRSSEVMLRDATQRNREARSNWAKLCELSSEWIASNGPRDTDPEPF